MQASLLWHLLYMHLWYIQKKFIRFFCTHILGVTCGVLETVQAFILRHLLYMHVTYICIFLNYSMRSVRSVSNSAGLYCGICCTSMFHIFTFFFNHYRRSVRSVRNCAGLSTAAAVHACYIYLHFFGIILGGPCGVLATVQAFLLRHLLYMDESLASCRPPAQCSRSAFDDALFNALADILWQAGVCV